MGIVIDQFRFDYLERFEDQFGPGGFKRFLNSGSVFANANYLHTPTYTACGHAAFMSGTTPSMNGIIGNDWFDRESGKRITSVSDSTVKLLGGREGQPECRRAGSSVRRSAMR
ncbi:MAG: alkaline phosphatase family protein [Acidobacteria bacterium]|nr:alkaline phosphatase family protein [Acidobacteriota bacterium]